MARGRPIRTLFWTLISLALAALVTLGGCLALVALQGDPVPRADRAPALALPGDPTPPLPLTSTLPREGSFVDATLATPAHPLRPPAGSLEVELRDRNEPTSDRRGVGVLDGASGALLAWRPLPAADAAQRVHFAQLPPGSHVVVLAEHERCRYAYTTRTSATVEAGREATATLDAHRQTIVVEVTLPAQLQPLATPSLQRVDDPSWYSAPIDVPRSRRDRLSIALPMLGAGDYRLALDGLRFENSEDGTLALRVPGPAQITTAAVPR